MVIKNVLLALEAGLGHGETCIFPIHIFKVKEGVNYNEGSFKNARYPFFVSMISTLLATSHGACILCNATPLSITCILNFAIM